MIVLKNFSTHQILQHCQFFSRIVTELPNLSQCSLTLEGAGQQLPTSCRPGNQTSFERIFTNIVPDQILGAWLMAYSATNIMSVSAPPYVEGYDVGVALAELAATVYRAASEWV